MEPVLVAWEGRPAARSLATGASAGCVLRLEDGEERGFVWEGGAPLVLPGEVPLGYHELVVEIGGQSWSSLVISAPRKAPVPFRRAWGVFAPVHSLHSHRSWGVGDLTDLQELGSWTGGMGAEIVAILPILSAFLDEPFDPSPYAPVSRLFFNELHTDPERLPELEHDTKTAALLASPGFRSRVEAVRAGSLVDHRAAMSLKREVLEALATSFFSDPRPDRLRAFQDFKRRRPEAADYARFRAYGERQRQPWRNWPSSERDGRLPASLDEDTAARYHLYAQWVTSEQLAEVEGAMSGTGTSLYLDLPLGVHRDGYDMWRQRDAFASGVSGGAPPDLFQTEGQNWGFAPLHPERIREQRYRYPIACFRSLLNHAKALRIDHVMGLHRLFWVPEGIETRDGVYVRYPAEELYAILLLEAHRAGAMVVGEDLGTVPGEVRTAMERRRVHRTYVAQFELKPDPEAALPPPPTSSVATLNTHDLDPFAAFWAARDIRRRRLDDHEARRELAERSALRDAVVAFLRQHGRLRPGVGGKEREEDAVEVARGCLRQLAGSAARAVVVNLEDLWGETESQNLPGTGDDEHPNWRRRLRYPLGELSGLQSVTATLVDVDRIRRGDPNDDGAQAEPEETAHEDHGVRAREESRSA